MAAVINLVRGLAIDCAAQHIRINAIAPDGTVTALTAAQVANPDLGPALARRIPQQRRAEARQPSARMAFMRETTDRLPRPRIRRPPG